jgi:hypothetical protein
MKIENEIINRIMKRIYPDGTYKVSDYNELKNVLKEELKQEKIEGNE